MNATAMNTQSYDTWLAAANDASDPLTLAFGGVLSRFPGISLDDGQQKRLLARYFPRLDALSTQASGDPCAAMRGEEFHDVVALLMDYRSDEAEETLWLAHAIATACMGEDHLYQDMGLPNREALSVLLRRHFTTLFEKNTANMKWKKFFYKQLCDRAEVRACRAPSCSVCNDYQKCFGPE